MKTTVTIQHMNAGSETGIGVFIPADVLMHLGWEPGSAIELHADETGVDLFLPKAFPEDFNRQVLAAKKAMRKYHVALSALGKT